MDAYEVFYVFAREFGFRPRDVLDMPVGMVVYFIRRLAEDRSREAGVMGGVE